jgi:pyruvate/2-oxoglutarate dehydrogenase complex dihydrolipoamide acyltransferase (E2) component
MPNQKSGFEVKRFPLSRRIIVDSARQGKRVHTITALVEADVTEARQLIQTHKEVTGEALSFTAFILTCLGQAIDQNKYFHARRDFWGRLILFDEVDCTTMIEIDFQGQKFPLAHIIRAINKRPLRDIHDEIRAIQADPQSSGSLQNRTRLIGAFLLLPAFMRDLVYGVMNRSPRLFKEQAGTVIVTAVGMFGDGGGWGIGTGSIYTTGVLLGGIAEKPAVVDGQIVVREFLNLTIGLDHDIIDGAPAARFINRFKDLIESAYGLNELSY